MTDAANLADRLEQWLKAHTSKRWPTRSMDDDLLEAVQFLRGLASHADVSERERALESMLKQLHDADVLGELDESMWTDARELLLNGSGTSPERS